MARVRRRRSSRRTRRIRRRGRGIKGVTAVGYGSRLSYKRPRPADLGMPFGVSKRARMGMGRRRRFGPRGPRRAINDTAGVNQWTQYKARRKLGRLTQRKINFAGNLLYRYVWRRANRLTTAGNILLNNYATATEIGVPIFLMDLTTNSTNGNPAFTMTRSATTYTFNRFDGFSSTGTQVPGWQEWRNGTATKFLHAILKSVTVKADLYGATSGPVKYQISLVQFDPDYIPVDLGDTTTVGINFADTEAINYWDGFFKKLTFNPSLQDPTPGTKKPIKTIWSRTFNINPSVSIDQDADPTCKTVTFHFKMNRRLNYMWKWDDASITALANFHTTNWDPQTTPEVRNVVDPRARVYLMITGAQFFTAASLAAQTTAKHPTFNLEVQRTLYGGMDV